MELYHKVTAVWSGGDQPAANCMLEIMIDVSRIRGALRQFDLFTVTSVSTRYVDTTTSTWKTAEYEYTKMHRKLDKDTINYTVTIYGDMKELEISGCTTQGYYVCKEE